MSSNRTFHTSKFFRFVLLNSTLLLAILPTFGKEHLILIGGGARPNAALSRFVEWAGKEQSHILIISWATEDPPGAFASISKDFAPFHIGSIELAPNPPLSSAAKEKFLSQLKNATGVFFTGGDQVRIMNVLKDVSLIEALRERYHAGVVFGGTSAGTAIMSRRMITGEGNFTVIDGKKVEVKDGLGLLPEGVIVDQHFIKRQRENRLFGLLLQGQGKLGLGIDEGTALLISDSRYAEIVGASHVMLIASDANQSNALIVRLMKSGDKFDLLKVKS